ncbi:MAG: phosphatase PAP2 family protein [Alphaproteobacteria bacterium]|nr:phosphatase PAP2 family protein [Alphaproteobacteria bacterium]
MTAEGRITLVLAAAVLVLGFWTVFAPAPHGVDVVLTRRAQDVFGASPEWALWITQTAKPPLLWATAFSASALAWIAGGWRAALAALIACALAFGLDLALRAVVFSPRPAPDIVHVAQNNTSSGLPSTLGLLFGASFGAVLWRARGARGALVAAIACAAIFAGAASRIVLGAHWSSQMIASLAMGGLCARLALVLVRRAFR